LGGKTDIGGVAACILVACWMATARSMAAEHAHGLDASSAEAHPVGKAVSDARAARTIDIDMVDSMRFTPQRIVVREGETIRFRVRNSGKLRHEFVFGAPEELEAHAKMMRDSGTDHAHMHGASAAHTHADPAHHPNALEVAPGETGTLEWRFTRAGSYRFACLVAGHYEAGMTGEIIVEKR
jgi:uncharacterized cupredoxin-like copper-binding protein